MDPLRFITAINKDYRKDCNTLNSDTPWSGHMVIKKTNDQVIAYKIGDSKADKQYIIDWRNPISAIFFSAEPGDEFETEEFYDQNIHAEGYKNVSGTLEKLTRVLKPLNRAIAHAKIADPKEEIEVRGEGDRFVVVTDDFPLTDSRDGLPDIRALLTKEQYELITSSNTKPVIIQGQAGSGKTTVALYRVSYLMFSEANEYPVDPKNVLIVMFNRALQSFVSKNLESLNLEDTNVMTFHAWALDAVKRAYKGNLEIHTDRIEGEKTAKALKKQIGLLNAMDEFVENQTQRLYQWLEQRLAQYEGRDWVRRLKKSNKPIVQRLIASRNQAVLEKKQATGRDMDLLEQIHKILSRSVERMTLYKEELLNFLKDKALLKKYLPHVADDELVQLENYQSSLQGIDRTERRPGPKIAFEDLALILRLIQLKHGGLHDKNREDQVKSNVQIYLYGKEINDETYAICKSDMMIKGNNPENIKVGSTLATDEFSSLRFDFMLSNPPYGKSWISDQKVIMDGKQVLDQRFEVELADFRGNRSVVPAIPRSSDGQLLFLMEMVKKMKSLDKSPMGSRIASVHNGSSLFTGDAG